MLEAAQPPQVAPRPAEMAACGRRFARPSLVEEAAAAAGSLQGQAAKLADVVGTFRLHDAVR